MKKTPQKDPNDSAFISNAESLDEATGLTIPPPKQFQTSSGNLPDSIRSKTEEISGVSLQDVSIEYNSSKPSELNAHAFAQGNNIHLGPGQEEHLAHETWHVVQQKQGRVQADPLSTKEDIIQQDQTLEQEADDMALKINSNVSSVTSSNNHKSLKFATPAATPIQRKVRTGYGSTKIKESDYQKGGSKENVGSKHKVSSLISDKVKRTFKDETELVNYANGATDYLGDVTTNAKGTYWYRLPKNKLTVLGESHQNPEGNVPDVINGFATPRFKYEPFNELEDIGAINTNGDSTRDQLDKVDGRSEVAGNVDKAKYNPALENIVIKAMTGCGLMRNAFLAKDPPKMSKSEIKTWSGRPTADDYSFGDRTALYFTMAIHIAEDVSKDTFGDESIVERPVITAARSLQDFYSKNQAILDDYKTKKDNDELIGIYELTAGRGFADLKMLEEFSKLFHVYAARYLQELGDESGNKDLVNEATALETNMDAGKGGKLRDAITPFSTAREEIIWNKTLEAKKGGFLIVGMGDAHRKNLKDKIEGEGIDHEEVTASLEKQKKDISAKWKP